MHALKSLRQSGALRLAVSTHSLLLRRTQGIRRSSTDAEGGEFEMSYFTDVEGNLAYFNRFRSLQALKSCASQSLTHAIRFMEISQVLKWDIDINTGERQIGFVDEPRKKRYVVFGGDLFDKGNGDIRLAHLFLKFKSRFPDRVFFLVGNRDINKIKLTAELDQSEVEGSRLDDLSGVICLQQLSSNQSFRSLLGTAFLESQPEAVPAISHSAQPNRGREAASLRRQ